MSWTLILIVVLVFLGLLVIFALKKQTKKDSEYGNSYQKRNALFTKTEINFLTILDEIIINKNLRVFGQVRMIDVIKPNYKLENWRSAKAKVVQKHLDYVVVNRNDYSIICVIELNDKSHNKPTRQKRDEFLRTICKSINLPLIEIKAAMRYDKNTIIEQIPISMLEIFLNDTKN